ncbi:hypothetical protein GCM10011608_09940 [Micromonospora sonchi]|uniref:Uncharacterized protein n=1 Tax=Micromonospora sonchi TaxID=1763543 RepID=A0A917TL32_9ACTN|nr:hypothetical protein [Micromonospora sonchi]GGM27148.1 hypothetical protein GCM10011608_09940 [Micromonospora sonchi]
MTQPMPMAVTTNGTVAVRFVPAIADPAAPTVTEVNAVSSVDLSCYLTGDGYNAETSENTVEDPRLCSKQIFEARGDYTDTLELTYVFNPASPDDDEARTTLPPGTAGFLVTRWGVDSEDAFATGDIVDVIPFESGAQRKNAPARNSVHRITQKQFITGKVQDNVAIVAGA